MEQDGPLERGTQQTMAQLEAQKGMLLDRMRDLEDDYERINARDRQQEIKQMEKRKAVLDDKLAGFGDALEDAERLDEELADVREATEMAEASLESTRARLDAKKAEVVECDSRLEELQQHTATTLMALDEGEAADPDPDPANGTAAAKPDPRGIMAPAVAPGAGGDDGDIGSLRSRVSLQKHEMASLNSREIELADRVQALQLELRDLCMVANVRSRAPSLPAVSDVSLGAESLMASQHDELTRQLEVLKTMAELAAQQRRLKVEQVSASARRTELERASAAADVQLQHLGLASGPPKPKLPPRSSPGQLSPLLPPPGDSRRPGHGHVSHAERDDVVPIFGLRQNLSPMNLGLASGRAASTARSGAFPRNSSGGGSGGSGRVPRYAEAEDAPEFSPPRTTHPFRQRFGTMAN